MRSQINVIVPLSVFMVSFFIFKLIYILTRAQHSYNKIGPITKPLNKESQLALLLSPLQQFFIYFFFIVFSVFGFKTNKQKTNKRERKKKKERKKTSWQLATFSLAKKGKEQSHSKNDLTSLSKKNIHLENMLQIGTMKNIQVIIFFPTSRVH